MSKKPHTIQNPFIAQALHKWHLEQNKSKKQVDPCAKGHTYRTHMVPLGNGLYGSVDECIYCKRFADEPSKVENSTAVDLAAAGRTLPGRTPDPNGVVPPAEGTDL